VSVATGCGGASACVKAHPVDWRDPITATSKFVPAIALEFRPKSDALSPPPS
jgi:hypothetical protein